MYLDRGAYGEVRQENGRAIKKFSKLSHLVQEYIALRYLRDCKYVVHAVDVDLSKHELHMELYDCNLRTWVLEQKRRIPEEKDLHLIFRTILLGLVELHDRRLAHGDLKPGNILVRRHPFRLVLGDCGFVSLARYSKVDRTAPSYRDPMIYHDTAHDMFSLGICMLEIIGGKRVPGKDPKAPPVDPKVDYSMLRQMTIDNIPDQKYRKVIYNLLHPKRSRRPTSRELLNYLYGMDPPRWIPPRWIPPNNSISSIPSGSGEGSEIASADRKYIRELTKKVCNLYKINRSKRGYGALLAFMQEHPLESSEIHLYTSVMLMIISSIFGRSGFREDQVIEICEHKYSLPKIENTLLRLIEDVTFINILLHPMDHPISG